MTKFSACVFGTKEQMRGGMPKGLSGMPGSSSVTDRRGLVHWPRWEEKAQAMSTLPVATSL